MLGDPPVVLDGEVLVAAAMSLSGMELTDRELGKVTELLASLGDWSETPNLPDCLWLGGQFTSLFMWRVPAAPRAVLFGGTVPGPAGEPISATGLSEVPAAALAACLGEAAETLAQIERDGDIISWMSLPEASVRGVFAARELAEMKRRLPRGEHEGDIAWVSAERLNDGQQVLLPASLCLRRPSVPHTPNPLSIGCAAGRSLETATWHALLELIERDALATWEAYGKPARQVESAARDDVLQWLQTQQCATEPGRMVLLDISAPHMPPVIAAFRRCETDEVLAFGCAAGTGASEAAIAALREMIAHDAGLTISHLRLKAGVATSGDREQLAKAQGNMPLEPSEPAVTRLRAQVSTLVEHFAHRGTPVYRVNLTRPDLRVAAVKLVCFGLTIETAGPG